MRAGDSDGPQSGVRYFLMGGGSGQPVKDDQGVAHLDIGGTWLSAPAWPPPRTAQVPFYFHAAATLRPTAPLGQQPTTGSSSDPPSSWPTMGANTSSSDASAPPR